MTFDMNWKSREKRWHWVGLGKLVRKELGNNDQNTTLVASDEVVNVNEWRELPIVVTLFEYNPAMAPRNIVLYFIIHECIEFEVSCNYIECESWSLEN